MHSLGGTYAKDIKAGESYDRPSPSSSPSPPITHLLVFGDAQSREDEEFRSDKVVWAIEWNKRRTRRMRERQLQHQQRVNGSYSRSVKREEIGDDSGELMPEVCVIWSEWYWDCLDAGGQSWFYFFSFGVRSVPIF